MYDMDGNDQCLEGTGRYIYYANPKDWPHFDYWVRPDGTHADTMPWRPSIHMPKEAARLFLRVTDVRVERLQDIKNADLRAEGIPIPFLPQELNSQFNRLGAINDCKQAREEFMSLWDSLNAARGYGWTSNPWVWVYTFERTEKPTSE